MPIEFVCLFKRLNETEFRWYPTSLANCWMWSLVSSFVDGSLFKARETVEGEQLNFRAMSLIVTGGLRIFMLVSLLT